MSRLLLLTSLFVMLQYTQLFAACPDDKEIDYLVKHYFDKQMLDKRVDLSIDDAKCGRDKFVERLIDKKGKIAGYKAGLTNPSVQKRFNYNQPVLGVLLENMLIKDGAEIGVDFGARPILEADLLIRVKDAEINNADTAEEVLQHIYEIIPFIELADLMAADLSMLDGAYITYINVGARLGVLGQSISAKDVSLKQLEEMEIYIFDEHNNEIGRGNGRDIMGNPLNAAVWIIRELVLSGKKLKAGDILSLGSFSKPVVPKKGDAVRVLYKGIGGSPAVNVKFR